MKKYIASLKADLKSGIIDEADYIETEFLTQGYVEDISRQEQKNRQVLYNR